MSTAFRFVALAPARIGMKWVKPAAFLHEFLTDHQTDASGMVNYGRAISYAWIRAHWPGNPDDRPAVRSLERHMATLKREGLVEVRVLGFGFGMVIRLLGSAKWQNERPSPATQLSLLSTVTPISEVEKPVEKPVEKQRKSTVSQIHMPPEVAVVGRQKWRHKEVKRRAEEKVQTVADAHVIAPVQMSPREIDERRRFLLDQAASLLKRTAKGSG